MTFSSPTPSDMPPATCGDAATVTTGPARPRARRSAGHQGRVGPGLEPPVPEEPQVRAGEPAAAGLPVEDHRVRTRPAVAHYDLDRQHFLPPGTRIVSRRTPGVDSNSGRRDTPGTR